MKTVREMFVSLTTILINPLWAPIIVLKIGVPNFSKKLKIKFENQISRHDKRYRSEDISPVEVDRAYEGDGGDRSSFAGRW